MPAEPATQGSLALACGEYLNVVRSDRSLSDAVEAQRARTAGTARRTAPRVVERKSTNEIIEEETGKIEVLVQYLRDSVDENGEPRLGASSVEDFKKLQALSSSALANALRKKANTELSLKKWHVTDAEMVSILRRRTGTDPMQLPSSVTPRVRPMPESDDDCDDFDDNVFDERFVQMVRARSKTSFLETSQTRRGREPPERGAHASNAVFYGN